MPTEKQWKSPSALFGYLSEKWPDAFNANAPKPLKIGIRADIRALDSELSDEDLSRALRAYTRTGKYLAQLLAGAMRVDLEGKAAGEVTEADAATAQAWLLARFAKAETTQSPEPKTEPEPTSKLDPKRAESKAKLSAERPAGLVVETKRRRSLGRRSGHR
ncbi:ProQ/FinO family protein [Sinorhizobium numidicum]|uniref:ProQ/FinO family protein n=1 Tax=Sinorhizobium numidicum TaxID=680248 RepID=A0ABY8CTL6_9HYPH|nr:ProQ/FinO family protein [Sinorhizobium numidicum]WEX74814.1 ProQ/FinO family protein [Sinorhizobium numidicum]WEX80807.1 ProQ/FinO family protein [Sinorhizobium numidicum]